MKRGEVWLVDLNPGFGREMHKKRPAIIISNNSIQENTPHAIVIPISSQTPKTIGVEMVLVAKKEGLDKRSVVLPVFIRSVDKSRLVKKIGKLSKAKITYVEKALQLVLGMNSNA